MLSKPIFGNLRKHSTGIVLAFLAISSTGFGITRWEASQTFNGLTIYCTSSKITRYPNASAVFPQSQGEFVVSIGFKNPNWFPVDVAWSATPLLNDSNYFSGFLQDVVPPLTSHVAKMPFAAIPSGLLSNNLLLSKVISYERYSILGDIFAEPRTYFISSDQTIILRPDDFMNVIANRMPIILWSVFIQHSNLLQSHSFPNC